MFATFLFADTGAEWFEFTKLWGPAIPMFFVFIFYLHRLIFRTVPRGFRSLRTAIVRAERITVKQHKEAMAVLVRVEHSIGELAACMKPAQPAGRVVKK